MRFVPIKKIEQQDIQSVLRIRERIVKARSSLACEIRGLLGEYGIVLPTGIREIKRKLPDILNSEATDLTSFTKQIMMDLLSEMEELSKRINLYDKYIRHIIKDSEDIRRLQTIPGVGPLSATAIIASVSDPSMFKNGREFAAYLGLVPRQNSSGGKQKLLGISKRGDKYIRTMLVHGARVVVSHNEKMNRTQHNRREWIAKLKERRGFCKTTVALANKNARICWALMTKNEDYKYAA